VGKWWAQCGELVGIVKRIGGQGVWGLVGTVLRTCGHCVGNW